MNVVWAYADWTGEGKSELQACPDQLKLFRYSVVSCIRFLPEFGRKLYVDQSIYNTLNRVNLLSYFTSVELVDFKEKITYDIGGCHPKIWAYTVQNEPFWVFDTDVVLTSDIESWFDSTKNYIWNEYTVNNADFTVEDIHAVTDFVRENSVYYEGIYNVHSISGAPIFYANPFKAKMLAYTILGLGKNIVPREVKGRAGYNPAEEGLYYAYTKLLGETFYRAPEGTFEHLPGPEIEKQTFLELAEKIGVNFEEVKMV